MKGLISPQPASAAQHRVRERILVVHPDEELREELRLQLKSAGYDVAVAEDAVVAGHRVLEAAPAAIVAAAEMPYMSGAELAAALRADETLPEIAVVLLTKPLVRDELLDAVARELELRGRAGRSSPPRS